MINSTFGLAALGIVARFRGNTPQREDTLVKFHFWKVVDVLDDSIPITTAYPGIQERMFACDRECELRRDSRRRNHVVNRNVSVREATVAAPALFSFPDPSDADLCLGWTQPPVQLSTGALR